LSSVAAHVFAHRPVEEPVDDGEKMEDAEQDEDDVEEKVY
jgi:hypothetical protein